MKLEIDFSVLRSLLVLATVIEARDTYTGGHTWRVSQYSGHLASMAGLSEAEIFITRIGGLVHDIGKIGITDYILNKKGKLDSHEYTIMKQHPVIGKTVIASHPLVELVQTAVVQHHERPDGKGYPDAKSDAQLSPLGKILSITDAFDAMTSTRSYRKGMSGEQAIDIIKENLGTQFDPVMGRIFIDMVKQGKADHILNHYAEDVPLLSCPECGPIIAPLTPLHDGGNVVCPSCTGEFIAHKAGDFFELEWKGTLTNFYIPQADMKTVESMMQSAPHSINL